MIARLSKFDCAFVWQESDAIAESLGVEVTLSRQAVEHVGGLNAHLDAVIHLLNVSVEALRAVQTCPNREMG